MYCEKLCRRRKFPNSQEKANIKKYRDGKSADLIKPKELVHVYTTFMSWICFGWKKHFHSCVGFSFYDLQIQLV